MSQTCHVCTPPHELSKSSWLVFREYTASQGGQLSMCAQAQWVLGAGGKTRQAKWETTDDVRLGSEKRTLFVAHCDKMRGVRVG